MSACHVKHTREARIACLLTTLRSAVELERKELERLHKIDIAATALDQLVQEHAKQKEQFEAAMEAQRSVWEENVQNTERERKEQEEAFKKQRLGRDICAPHQADHVNNRGTIFRS